jgi:hypothetical protein
MEMTQMIPQDPPVCTPSGRVAIGRATLVHLVAAAQANFHALYDPSDDDWAANQWADQLQRALAVGYAVLKRLPRPVAWEGPYGVASRLTSRDASVMIRAELQTGNDVVPGRDSVIEVALLAYRCGLNDAGQEVAP